MIVERKSSPPVLAQGFYSYSVGGSERIGADLAYQYRKRGYEVVCFALYASNGPVLEELTSNGIRCLDMDYTSRRRLTRRVTFQYEMWRMLKRERVAALHLHHTTSLIIAGLPAALAGVRTVMSEHGIYQLIEWPHYRKAARRYVRFADAVTVVSPDQVDYFVDTIGAQRAKTHYVPNGIEIRTPDANTRRSIRQEFGIEPATFLFLYVGRLHETKDLGTLLEAVAKWPAHVRAAARLILVGDGPEAPRLQELAEGLGIRKLIQFAGARRDVRNILMAGDAFVMSSRTEGQPMALLEAMATRLPCVSTGVGGVTDLLSGDCGLVVPPADAAALCRAMTSVLESEDLRTSLSTKAVEKAKSTYAIDAVVDRYLQLLGLPSYWPENAVGLD